METETTEHTIHNVVLAQNIIWCNVDVNQIRNEYIFMKCKQNVRIVEMVQHYHGSKWQKLASEKAHNHSKMLNEAGECGEREKKPRKSQAQKSDHQRKLTPTNCTRDLKSNWSAMFFRRGKRRRNCVIKTRTKHRPPKICSMCTEQCICK